MSVDQLHWYRTKVSSDGIVYFVPMVKLTAKCSSIYDHRYMCQWKFGSWVYNGLELDLYTNDDGINFEDYEGNPEWEIDNTTSTREMLKYACCPESYIHVLYTMILKRKELGKEEPIRRKSGLFSYVTRGDDEVHDSDMTRVLLLPTVIVSLLVPFQFLVPPESCQRITVCKSILFIVVRTIITEN